MHIGFSPLEEGNITIFGFEIRFYAICILVGALAALYFCRRYAIKKGLPKDLFDNTFIYAFMAGIFGARLWYVIAEWGKYFSFNNLSEILNFRDGGLAVQGGVILGALTGYFYIKKNFKNFPVTYAADIAVPTILVAQAIGRWGNFFNHEVYGACVKASNYWFLPGFIKDNLVIDCGLNQIATPLFLYESLINIFGFILIHFIIRKVYSKTRFYRHGDFVSMYFIWYGTVRIIMEPLRASEFIMGELFSTTLLMSIIYIIIGLLLFLLVHKNQIFKPKIKLVIFDLDGTLLDNNEYILKCYRHLFSKYNPTYELTVEEEISFLGPPLAEMFPKYFKKDVNSLIKEYREFGVTIEKDMLKLFGEVEEILKYLKDNNYKVALNTSKIHKAAVKNLEQFNIFSYFDLIIGVDDVKHAKPSKEGIIKICKKLKINRLQSIMIGDSIGDIQAGKNAFGYTGLVGWSLKKEIVSEYQPDLILNNFDDLKNYLKGN